MFLPQLLSSYFERSFEVIQVSSYTVLLFDNLLVRTEGRNRHPDRLAMTAFSQYVLLFAATYLIGSILASPALPLLNIDQNSTALNIFNLTDLNNDYQCYEAHLLNDRRAKTIDCLRAALFLPNLHEEGTFHRGSNPQDLYALPKIQVFQTCRVQIDLKFGRADKSTWLAIHMALRGVIDACQFKMSGGRTGGQTTAGNAGRITITAESVTWHEQHVASAKRLGR